MTISIHADEKGKIYIPKEFGIRPKEKLFVDKIDDMIVIKKVNKEVGHKIAKILEKNLKNVNSSDIEGDREDREW